MKRCLLILAACANRDPAGPTITVHAFAGDNAAAGVTVISHHPDGTVISTMTTDAVGDAEILTAKDAQISVLYPAEISSITPAISIVTTTAAPDLTVHGPADDQTPPTVIGVLDLNPMKNLAADAYSLQLGCVTLQLTTLTQPIDIGSRCTGSDLNLDVLLTATKAGAFAGYAAGRVPLSGDTAVFAPAQWDTQTGAVPITLTNVTPALDWVLWSDGLPFDAQAIQGTAPIWNNLVVDTTTVHATLAQIATAQITTRESPGIPTAIAFSDTDFLPPIDVTLSLDASSTALTWTPANVGADVVDVRLSWVAGVRAPIVPPGPHMVVWDVVLAPDASSARLPQLGDLATVVGPPDATPDALVRYLDGPDTASFSDVLAAGLYVEDRSQPASIVAHPTNGQVRETDATGYTP